MHNVKELEKIVQIRRKNMEKFKGYLVLNLFCLFNTISFSTDEQKFDNMEDDFRLCISRFGSTSLIDVHEKK